MTPYFIRIEVPQGKVQELLNRIDKAQEEIYACYAELRELGVVTVREEAASGN